LEIHCYLFNIEQTTKKADKKKRTGIATDIEYAIIKIIIFEINIL
jgi:hypothetical protein